MTGKYTLNKYLPTTGRHLLYSEHPLYLWHPGVTSDNFLDKDFAPPPLTPSSSNLCDRLWAISYTGNMYRCWLNVS